MLDLLASPWVWISLTSLFGVLALVSLWKALCAHRKVKGPVCRRCGYSMQGLDKLACPECGYEHKHAKQMRPRWVRWRWLGLAMLLAMAAWYGSELPKIEARVIHANERLSTAVQPDLLLALKLTWQDDDDATWRLLALRDWEPLKLSDTTARLIIWTQSRTLHNPNSPPARRVTASDRLLRLGQERLLSHRDWLAMIRLEIQSQRGLDDYIFDQALQQAPADPALFSLLMRFAESNEPAWLNTMAKFIALCQIVTDEYGSGQGERVEPPRPSVAPGMPALTPGLRRVVDREMDRQFTRIMQASEPDAVKHRHFFIRMCWSIRGSEAMRRDAGRVVQRIRRATQAELDNGYVAMLLSMLAKHRVSHKDIEPVIDQLVAPRNPSGDAPPGDDYPARTVAIVWRMGDLSLDGKEVPELYLRQSATQRQAVVEHIAAGDPDGFRTLLLQEMLAVEMEPDIRQLIVATLERWEGE